MSALGRINDDGSGALTHGLTDPDASTQIAAMEAAGRVSAISDPTFVPQLTSVLGSSNALVRKHAVQLLDSMDIVAADAAILALAKGDADEDVRIIACHALGTFGNSADMATLQYIATNDSSGLVRTWRTSRSSGCDAQVQSRASVKTLSFAVGSGAGRWGRSGSPSGVMHVQQPQTRDVLRRDDRAGPQHRLRPDEHGRRLPRRRRERERLRQSRSLEPTQASTHGSDLLVNYGPYGRPSLPRRLSRRSR